MCCFSDENTIYLTDIQSFLLFGQPSKIYPIVQKTAKTVQRAWIEKKITVQRRPNNPKPSKENKIKYKYI